MSGGGGGGGGGCRAVGQAAGWADVNVSFPEHNSATIKNILLILGRTIEQGLVVQN